MNTLKIIVIVAILSLGIYVALSPGVVYAPTPRIVLYFLICFLPSLLLGAEATSRFELQLPGFVFTTAGACAICFGALLLVTHLAKPEEKIAVYQIYDEHNEPVALDWDGAIDIPITAQGLSVTRFIDRNSVIVIFPEQVSLVEIRIKKSYTGHTYTGNISYSGNRTAKIVLGESLN